MGDSGSIRTIIIGTATLIGIYVLANVAYVAALGLERSANSERIAAEAVAEILGPAAGKLIAVAILFLGCLCVAQNTEADFPAAVRIFFADGADIQLGCTQDENCRVIRARRHPASRA